MHEPTTCAACRTRHLASQQRLDGEVPDTGWCVRCRDWTPVSGEPPCSCARIKVGGQLTGSRNWNPDCTDHGIKSEWYNSPEQVERRRVDNEQLRELQRRAREARREARQATSDGD